MEQNKYNHYMMEYTSGSAVRKLQPQTLPKEAPRPQIVEPLPRPEKRPLFGEEMLHTVFMACCVIMTAVMCVMYLTIQAQIVDAKQKIYVTRSSVASLQKENNIQESMLENEAVDLEYVYQVAVGYLGMVYPNNNEVIYYSNEAEGYYRQYQDIPE